MKCAHCYQIAIYHASFSHKDSNFDAFRKFLYSKRTGVPVFPVGEPDDEGADDDDDAAQGVGQHVEKHTSCAGQPDLSIMLILPVLANYPPPLFPSSELQHVENQLQNYGRINETVKLATELGHILFFQCEGFPMFICSPLIELFFLVFSA